MSHGRIAGYQFDGKPLGEVSGATATDPMAIRCWKGTIWLADYTEPLLQRFTVEHDKFNPAADIQSPALARLSTATRRQQASGERLSNIGILGFALVLAGGFIDGG